MKELTPEEVRAVAEKVNSTTSKSGKTLYPQWINSTDELVEQYGKFIAAWHQERHADSDRPEDREKITEMIVKLKTDMFQEELPALIYLFKRFLSQH